MEESSVGALNWLEGFPLDIPAESEPSQPFMVEKGDDETPQPLHMDRQLPALADFQSLMLRTDL